MKIKIYIVWCVLCLAMCSLGFGQSPLGVRVATINVNNYLLADRMVDGLFLKDYPKPEAERKALHALLLEVNPDVVALQEIGEMSFLKELQADLKALGLYYPEIILLEGPDPTRHLAFLSKIKPLNVVKHSHIPFKYFGKTSYVRRGLLELEFYTKGKKWKLYTLHLKSHYTTDKRDNNSIIMRKSESYALRNHIYKRDSLDTPYLIVGDFNDNHYTSTVKAFLKKSKTPLAKVLPTYDSRLEAWTFHNNKTDSYSRLDYILASVPMLPFIKEGKGHIEDILPHSLIASDHRLLYVDLVF